MTIFHLPDLGEGLAEATIHEWHVKTGDAVKTDQLMVSVETAKAVVEVPSPYDGVIKQLFGKAGDVIKTGEALIEIETHSATATVAGKLETSDIILEPETFTQANTTSAWQSNAEKLSGIRLSMAQNMRRAADEVVSASIFDEADISAWPEKTDITARLIQAVCYACQKEPNLNAWFDGRQQKKLVHKEVHLGLALDTPQGLLVPVIKNAEKKSAEQLRETINQFKNSHLTPDHFQGGTISLSNIGTMAGYFATPIVLPPTVAIIASGKINKQTKKLPLSISFDHRMVTGGEASRFLGAMMEALAK
ncbi:MAG TPA: dihydrolipoamide acetyltransferase family protein [Gammaproteobacteria bacterium]|nr:dihydrolipoamide acetyltransferase family protein [Gammaproteobacteria bacterium]